MKHYVPILMPLFAVAAATLALPALAQDQQQQTTRQRQSPNEWPACSAQVQQGCIMPDGQFIQPDDGRQSGQVAPGMIDENLGIGDRRSATEAPPPQ